ncbi:DsbA family protein [Candidatus Woesearchaeota archaeon]|mgnify:FL=1|jgi:protein-disulfide isomerase|nr:DsbA family protein [Candidatus Woesearchaeota archaeon]MBT3438603.1 DsbA family protein [Candidatus Woesearchaeota archaeon]MBT4058499.1 DsbA family protein [Candidatus Woesearchaeota archaeon]MBT4207288.1 DsbA family protein [Candidatus Woesearchaeota archaeon]MBT4733190.1 DsbA family protein [Candidatus Woesearchaeota archaeon]
MAKNRGKRVKIEFDEINLWKAGTIIFGILFILCSMKGGSDAGVGDAPTIEAPTPLPQAAPKAPSAPVDVEIGDAYVKGKKNAKVEIIEFSDFECSFCGRFYSQTYKQILENYVDTGKVKFAFKHLPLPFHSNAQKASEATECAGKLGKDDAFWGMHDAIFDNQARGMSVSQLKGYAADLGLDQGDFDSCLDNGDMEAKVKAHAAEAAKLGASGTPTFFINGVKLVGAQPYAAFEAAIEAAL